MKLSISALLLTLIAGFSSMAQATVVVSGAGLATYDRLVTFLEPTLASDTLVTNQYAAKGLTFSVIDGGLRANGCGLGRFSGVILPGYVNTFGAGCVTNSVIDSFSMKFDGDVTAASFALYSYAGGNAGNSVTAYRDGIAMDQITVVSMTNYVTFSGFVFDELRFVETSTDENYVALDTVAFKYAEAAQVPEPGSVALIGLGLMGLVAARRRAAKGARSTR